MPSPRLTTTLLLMAIVGCVSYFAFSLYVHRHSGESLSQAVADLKDGEPATVRHTLKWLTWFEPQNPRALYLTGLSYLREADMPSAITYLERVSATSTIYKDARINLAAALVADQQWERAFAVLWQYVSRYRESLIARRQLSGLLLTELRQREAVGVLTDYLQISASGRISLADRQTALLDLLIAEFAPPPATVCLPTLEEVNRQRPHQSSIRLALGRCYWKAGMADKAEPLLKDALQQHPRDPQTRLICCGFFLDQSDADTAETALTGGSSQTSAPADEFDKALEQDDRFHELHCRIAELRGNYQVALKHIEQALIMQPLSREYEARRARLLQRLQRGDDARDAYDRSHQLGKVELELWHLSQTLGEKTLTATQCEQVADLHESLKKNLQAAAWRQLAEQIRQQSPLETAP